MGFFTRAKEPWYLMIFLLLATAGGVVVVLGIGVRSLNAIVKVIVAMANVVIVAAALTYLLVEGTVIKKERRIIPASLIPHRLTSEFRLPSRARYCTNVRRIASETSLTWVMSDQVSTVSAIRSLERANAALTSNLALMLSKPQGLCWLPRMSLRVVLCSKTRRPSGLS